MHIKCYGIDQGSLWVNRILELKRQIKRNKYSGQVLKEKLEVIMNLEKANDFYRTTFH